MFTLGVPGSRREEARSSRNSLTNEAPVICDLFSYIALWDGTEGSADQRAQNLLDGSARWLTVAPDRSQARRLPVIQ